MYSIEDLRESFPTYFRSLVRGGDEVLVIDSEDLMAHDDYIHRSNVNALVAYNPQFVKLYDHHHFRSAYVELETLDNSVHCEFVYRILRWLEEFPLYDESHYYEMINGIFVDYVRGGDLMADIEKHVDECTPYFSDDNPEIMGVIQEWIDEPENLDTIHGYLIDENQPTEFDVADLLRDLPVEL